MIDQTLRCIVHDFNAHWRTAMTVAEDGAVLSHLVNLDGTVPPRTDDRIVVLLLGWEPAADRVIASPLRNTPAAPAPHVALNLHVLFAAAHADYPSGLTALGHVGAYFDGKPVFNPTNTPHLPPEIQSLSAIRENPGYAELSQIWTALRLPLRPSVIYTLRLRT